MDVWICFLSYIFLFGRAKAKILILTVLRIVGMIIIYNLIKNEVDVYFHKYVTPTQLIV